MWSIPNTVTEYPRAIPSPADTWVRPDDRVWLYISTADADVLCNAVLVVEDLLKADPVVTEHHGTTHGLTQIVVTARYTVPHDRLTQAIGRLSEHHGIEMLWANER